MIIGNGLLAKEFNDYYNDDSIIIFASGVSNSKEDDPKEFEREKFLLTNTIALNKLKLLVYFSTCSIEDKSQKKSYYINHKRQMETIIQNCCEKYLIFRLPQVVGISKSPTIINSFVDLILNNKPLNLYKNATRNLIDVNDVYKISVAIINSENYNNQIINIATPYNVSVLKIVEILEKLLNKKADIRLLDLGEVQEINIEEIEKLGILFNENYIENILQRYIEKKSFNNVL